MLVIMRQDATKSQISRVVKEIKALGFEARPMRGTTRTAIGIVGNDVRIDPARLAPLDGVRNVVHITEPYRQASREWQLDNTVVPLRSGVSIGSHEIVVAAGPCSVESEQQILEIAHAVRECGAVVLRGGAFKPRTSPYSFQGLGPRALAYLARAGEATGLAVVTEVMDTDSVDAVAEHADVIQIGARNMQNFSLLKRVGRVRKPVLLKRGIAATITELLLSAEYLLTAGNDQVILCERGVRGFDPESRNVLDLTAVPLIHELSHLPVIVDPSHGTGNRDLVAPMSLAAVAAGADGLMIEVHPNPAQALSDGVQSLDASRFEELMLRVRGVATAVGRPVAELATAQVAP